MNKNNKTRNIHVHAHLHGLYHLFNNTQQMRTWPIYGQNAIICYPFITIILRYMIVGCKGSSEVSQSAA